MAKPILGTRADDVLASTASDKVIAMAGDDTITVAANAKMVNGGPGYDTAIFETTAYADADISAKGHGNGPVTVDGVKLIGVEAITFSDVTIDARSGAVIGAAADNVVVTHLDGSFDSYATIKEAVAASLDGETIFVGAGTYAEGSVLVDKDITIVGAEGATLEGGFYVGAGGDGATIDNLTIEGGAAVVGEAGPVGVFVQADNVTVTNSTFIGDNVDATADRGLVTSIGDAQGLIVSGNTFTDFNTGVYLNPGTNAQVTDNTFDHNYVGLSADQDSTSDVQVSGNTFENSVFQQVGFGVLGANNTEDVGAQVFDNTFVGTAPETTVYLLDAQQTAAATVGADTFIWADDNASANTTWTIESFNAATDQLDIGAATVTTSVASLDGVTLTLSTHDVIEVHGVGLTPLNTDTWLV